MSKMRHKLLQKLWLPITVMFHLLYVFVYWWMGQDLSVTTKVKWPSRVSADADYGTEWRCRKFNLCWVPAHSVRLYILSHFPQGWKYLSHNWLQPSLWNSDRGSRPFCPHSAPYLWHYREMGSTGPEYLCKHKKTKTDREGSVIIALKLSLYKQDATMCVTLYSHQTEEGHLLCSAYQEFNINSLMLAKLSTGDALIPSFPAHLSSQKIKWKFIHLLFFVCPVFLSNNFTWAPFTPSLCMRAHVQIFSLPSQFPFPSSGVQTPANMPGLVRQLEREKGQWGEHERDKLKCETQLSITPFLLFHWISSVKQPMF